MSDRQNQEVSSQKPRETTTNSAEVKKTNCTQNIWEVSHRSTVSESLHESESLTRVEMLDWEKYHKQEVVIICTVN